MPAPAPEKRKHRLPFMELALRDPKRSEKHRFQLAKGWWREGYDVADLMAGIGKDELQPAKVVTPAGPGTWSLVHPGLKRPPYGVGHRVHERLGIHTTCPLCAAARDALNELGPKLARLPENLDRLGPLLVANAKRLRGDAEHATLIQRAGIAIGLAVLGERRSEDIAKDIIVRACDDEQAFLDAPVRWSVFVRTAPRKEATLVPCVESIIAAGWTPTVCAEPGTDVSGLPPGVPVMIWPEKKGAWGSMLSILRGRLAQEHDEEWTLVFEDDCILTPGAREFVEASGVLAEPKVGFVSMWTSSRQHAPAGGWHRVTEHLFRGSVAMAFPRANLKAIVNDPQCDSWRGKDGVHVPPDVWNVDTVLTKICHRHGLRMWTHSPSLSQHIGNTSTLPGHGTATGGRKAKEVAVLPVTRQQILQRIVRARGVRSYLEIGCRNDVTFSVIDVPHKVGVDPERGGTHRMTSDEFFAQNTDRFDLVFVDGLHLRDQVLRDVDNALRCLTPSGVIVLHDCLPREEGHQLPEPEGGDRPWNGTVWQAAVELRCRPDLDLAVMDCDWGCGVIVPRPNPDPLDVAEPIWEDFRDHGTEWLRLRPPTELEAFLGMSEPVSVLIPLSGRKWAWPMLAAWLDRQTYPRHLLHLRILDTSQDAEFSAMVEEWAGRGTYPRVTLERKAVGEPGLADLSRRQNGRAVNQAVAAAWATLSRDLRTTWALCVEDDIEPPDDVLARLLGDAAAELDAVSACYRSRAADRHWVLRDHPSRNIPDQDEGRGVQRIAGSGFGCLLVRSEILARHPFEQLAGEGWYDWRFFDVENVRAACDWSLQCRHYQRPGECV